MEKEEKIRAIALSYYSRKDVLNAMFNFSEDREVSPRYFEGFGKRPDSLQYPSDILALVKRGATSFHCSEELWNNPLEIQTGMVEQELNELRKGWDLVIDIDCKWIYYSKKAAISIIDTLDSLGVKNIGIKFSGSKGFHILVPWKAFPETMYGKKTKDMFPEWPRAIVSYLKEKSAIRLSELIKDTESDFKNLKEFSGTKCKTCSNLVDKHFQITVRCDKCSPPHIETFSVPEKNYKPRKCPVHRKHEMYEVTKQEFHFCSNCRISSLKEPDNFIQDSTNLFGVLGLDVLLVSSRHLFRMPYSLHEKTSLSSIVLDKNQVEDFEIKDADPLNIKIREFMPNPEKNEAEKLLFEAIDWHETNEKKEEKPEYKEAHKNKQFTKLEPSKITEEIYPPPIQKMLKGMADGRKRALFILINFFRSIGYSLEEVEKKLNDWNKKNNPPIKQGYINAQIMWHSKNKPVLPPNFNNEIYKAIGVYEMDQLALKVKNPINYVIAKLKSPNKSRKKF